MHRIKQQLDFKDACRLANDILAEGTDQYFFMATKGDASTAGGDGDTETIAAALASEMEHEEIRDIILRATVMYTIAHGKEFKLPMPSDPSSN